MAAALGPSRGKAELPSWTAPVSSKLTVIRKAMEATGRCLLLGRNESFTTNSRNSIQNKQKRETTGKYVPGVTGTPSLRGQLRDHESLGRRKQTSGWTLHSLSVNSVSRMMTSDSITARKNKKYTKSHTVRSVSNNKLLLKLQL